MRLNFVKEIRPEALSKLLLQLYSKKYHADYIKHKHGLERLWLLGINVDDKGMFSKFSNKMKYNNSVLRGKYLLMVYKKVPCYSSTFHGCWS